MTVRALRWWPVAAFAVLIVLGLAVGKGSTNVDDEFHWLGAAHPRLDALLYFTDPRVLGVVGAITLAANVFRRRWRLVAATVVTPVVALTTARMVKRLFGRQRDGALAYPSGHTTTAVVVYGLAVLAVGVAAWTVLAAVVATVLALLGQSFTYHYFTDTVGAVFLGTAMLSLAVVVFRLDECQPRCDPHHTGR